MTAQKMIAGTAILAGANALRICMQLLILPIIARLLGPSEYGIVALATPFIFFLLIFSDLGLGPTLVRAKILNTALEQTVFWITVATGVIFASLLAVLAYPLSHALGRVEVAPILLALSSLLILAALAVVPFARLQRQCRFGTVATSEILSAFAGMGVAIYGSLNGWGAFALIGQQFTIWAIKLGIGMVASHFRPMLRFDLETVKGSLGFGVHLTGTSLVAFLSSNIDNILIGSILGPITLGFYALAYQIVSIPSMVLGAMHYSLFPAFAQAQGQPARLKKTYLEAFRVVLLIATPAICGLVLVAHLLVPLLLGDKWLPVADLLCLLAPIGLLNPLAILNGAFLLGIGQSKMIFRCTLLRATAIVIGIVVGLAHGAEGVALGASVGYISASIYYLRYVMKIGQISIGDLLEASCAPMIATLGLACGVLILQMSALSDYSLTATFILTVIAGCLAYIGTLFVGFRKSFMNDVLLVRSLVRKGA